MKGWLMMWNEHEQNISGVYMKWMDAAGVHGHGATTPEAGQAAHARHGDDRGTDQAAHDAGRT